MQWYVPVSLCSGLTIYYSLSSDAGAGPFYSLDYPRKKNVLPSLGAEKPNLMKQR